ncbi:LysR substrate-binding domain-containing protein [Salinicola rhizosphaerae]|uniref:LysR family transcriptional regulator n=1 Tax=Salinicola rhizosphaerae TaxID=1443141 RepID=A0ABQ3E6D4_9GAMM|nr:LysR substrate-binding domain-containing protein [Salinicola rhizosphaerae]GHB24854.1 LysR family transcriptional regulator [Salinicola rhizosphaerae]
MNTSLNSQTHAWLKVFAVSARHLSFTRAAEELHVTTGAISQQIKQLEERLGFRLFRRLPRRLALTEEGERLAGVVAKAYDAVGIEVDRLRGGVMSGVIRLRCLPSFLAKWLMPRLPRLQARFPDIDLHVSAEDSNLSLLDGGFDLAIDLNDGQYPGLQTTHLIDEQIFAVCSPQLLRRRPPLTHPGALGYYPLLHDVTAWRGSHDYAEWEHYLSAIGGRDVNVRRGYTFNRNQLTVEAAIAGMGVAIARRTLLGDELESGRLIAPFSGEVATGKRYGLVYPQGALDDRRVGAIHDWLEEEAQRGHSSTTLQS